MRHDGTVSAVNCRGFTLVELLISMLIGAVLLTAIYGVFISSSESYKRLQGLADTQERGRIAMTILQDTIQAADYTGCRSDVTINNVLTNSGNYEYNFGQGIEGFDSTGAAWSPAIDVSIPQPLAAGGDVITVRGPVGNPVKLSAAMASATAALTVPAGSPFVQGDILMAGDCAGGADVFEKTDAGGATVTSIAHSGGGNSVTNLGTAYGTQAIVVKVGTTTFFIRDTSGIRSLWWKEGAANAQELIEGVDGMQVQYGVTTNTDTSANQYMTAAAVDAAGQWANVVSVRIAILVATTRAVSRTQDTTVYGLLGAVYGPFNDFRLRRVFMTNIVLRNRSF